MTSILPERIECVVTHEGSPVQGLMLEAQLKTTRKNPHQVLFGPTDALGRVVLLRSEIEEWAASELYMAIMDFDPLEHAFSGIIELRVINKKELADAVEAYEAYKEETSYPQGYLSNLHKAREILEGMADGACFHISASVKPDSIKMIIR
ncbi:MAG TPA: hypothetical protein VMW16_12235 [Sedimentisphaerales bacterium]|nr:hypothetical protein [Sedimentisphaerales bacterium]